MFYHNQSWNRTTGKLVISYLYRFKTTHMFCDIKPQTGFSNRCTCIQIKQPTTRVPCSLCMHMCLLFTCRLKHDPTPTAISGGIKFLNKRFIFSQFNRSSSTTFQEENAHNNKITLIYLTSKQMSVQDIIMNIYIKK